MTAKSKKGEVLEVQASPTKRFFVDMLTRDIELDDALLDLLDNCVDGVLRQTKGQAHGPKPYAGYGAEIDFSPKEFRIKDNCGGMDEETAQNYAFMMGRKTGDQRDRDLPTVGMYGIGMKRAIFKLGRSAIVRSQHVTGAFEVRIQPAWFTSDDDWRLRAHRILQLDKQNGTMIEVKDLLPNAKALFGRDSDFEAQFIGKLQSHYAFIMHKGFEVKVNGKQVEPRPIRFLLAPEKTRALAPYMFDAKIDGVDVQVTVGFYKPLQTDEEVEADMEARRSREDAGWTVICNDRVVLYCDKTRTTGWGEATVPIFHAQFNAIAGVAIFSTNDPLKLPVTTTKRGIDAGSDLYLRVKERMREGTKVFTSYTNQWKHDLPKAKNFEKGASAVDLAELRGQVDPKKWAQTNKKGEVGRKYMPSLPVPAKGPEDMVIMRFLRPAHDVRLVGDALLDDPDARPADVAGAAFDATLTELKR